MTSTDCMTPPRTLIPLLEDSSASRAPDQAKLYAQKKILNSKKKIKESHSRDADSATLEIEYAHEIGTLIKTVNRISDTAASDSEKGVIKFNQAFLTTQYQRDLPIHFLISDNTLALKRSEVLGAFHNPNWDYRTAEGIANETGTNKEFVCQVIKNNPDIRKVPLLKKDGESIYCAKGKGSRRKEYIRIIKLVLGD